jgi:hypothetical protein
MPGYLCKINESSALETNRDSISKDNIITEALLDADLIVLFNCDHYQRCGLIPRCRIPAANRAGIYCGCPAIGLFPTAGSANATELAGSPGHPVVGHSS